MSPGAATAHRRASPRRATTPAASVDPKLKDLLDHVAEDLAQEYVALMKAAAERENEDSPGSRDKSEGG